MPLRAKRKCVQQFTAETEDVLLSSLQRYYLIHPTNTETERRTSTETHQSFQSAA